MVKTKKNTFKNRHKCLFYTYCYDFYVKLVQIFFTQHSPFLRFVGQFENV